MMKAAQNRWVIGIAMGVASVVGAGSAFAQSAAPTDNVGVEVKVLEAIDLGPQFPAMAGHQLRLRYLTLQPGGHVGLHSHKDRPAEDYILKGAVAAVFVTADIVKP